MTTREQPPGSGVDFLSGEEEVAYAHQQTWGAYWTGSRLLVGGVAMGFGAFLFAFFYLRNLNSSGLWYVHGQRPSLIFGGAVLSLLVVSAALTNVVTRRFRRIAATPDWLVGAGVAFALGLLAVILQSWELGRLPFQPGRSGYASLFAGWQPVMIVSMLGGLYWLETLIARAVRIRPLLSHPEGELGVVPDVALFRGSLDGFVLYWTFIAAVEVVVFILFYVVH